MPVPVDAMIEEYPVEVFAPRELAAEPEAVEQGRDLEFEAVPA